MQLRKSVYGAVILMLVANSVVCEETSEPSVRYVSLQRTACLGDCPVYDVTIRSDGTVWYVGIESVGQSGERQSQISTQNFARVVSELKAIDFFRFESRRKGRRGCLHYKTDFPSITIRAVTAKADKSVYLYTGCSDTKSSLALMKLAELIDEVANTPKWINQASDQARPAVFVPVGRSSVSVHLPI